MPSSVLRKPTTYLEQLSAIPVHNVKAVKLPESTPEVWVMEVALEHHKVGFLARWFNLNRRRRYQLDGVGLKFYTAIDGERTLLDFVREYQVNNKLTFFEARGIVLEYAKMLTQRGLIVLVVPELDKPNDAIDET